MSILFVWLYIFKCDVCVLNHMWIKPKIFLFFLFAFGSDLYHLYFSKFFKLFLCEKHVLWVFLWPISCVSSIGSLMAQFLSFSTLNKEFYDFFASKTYPQEISRVSFSWKFSTHEIFQINFLKDISWVICFKLLPYFPKPLF